MPKKLIVANWKMNLPNLAPWRGFRTPKNTEIVVCPPFPYLPALSKILNPRLNPRLGAQNCFWEEKGAYTGEVSPKMLKSFGAEYVILGHSERRRRLRETDEMVNKKVSAALKAGLKVILCVGEPLAVRRKGLRAAKLFVASQLRDALRGVKKILNPKSSRLRQGFGGQAILNSRLIVAYEPIWAIGTGRADKPEDSAAMANFIKKTLYSKFSIQNSMVLYGGSVTSKNAKKFLEHKEVDGALVGGASLNPNEFGKICALASRS